MPVFKKTKLISQKASEIKTDENDRATKKIRNYMSCFHRNE